MWQSIKHLCANEPLVISGVAAAAMAAVVEFGIPLTSGQQTAVQGVIAAVMLWIARSNVASRGTLKDAGTTLHEVARVAAMPGVVLEPVQLREPPIRTGVTFDVRKAEAEYAAAIGKSVEQLTDEERKGALVRSALKEAAAGISGTFTPPTRGERPRPAPGVYPPPPEQG